MEKGIYGNDEKIRTKTKIFSVFYGTNRISDVIVQRNRIAAAGYLQQRNAGLACTVYGTGYFEYFCSDADTAYQRHFSAKGSRASQVIWAGTMITNIYSFMLYCFAVHFNVLFHFYCIILGLSVYAMIYFSAKYYDSDFGAWYKSELFGKATGIFLLVTAGMFYFLWLSQSLPAVLSGSVPETVAADALLTNPVHVLDYSFYLPLILISGIMLLRRNRIGYFLAPMMLVFELLTDVNIISLSVVTMVRLGTDSLVLVCGFTAFAVITLCILIRFLKRIKIE